MISMLWSFRFATPFVFFPLKFNNSAKRIGWKAAWCVLAVVLCSWSSFAYAQTTAHFAGFETVVASKGLNQCYGVAVDGKGNVYVADTFNNRVLKETLSAGQYTESVVASGLNLPYGVAVDGSGNVYIADRFNKRVIKETPSGEGYAVTVVASGLSTSVPEVAVDNKGNVYIPDTVNNQVLMETPSGNTYKSSIVANEANNGLRGPVAVAVDGSGNLYISDYGNNRVLKETPLVAGGYTQSIVASGLDSPRGVAVDASGNVYIANTYSNEILMETLSSGSYTESTVPTGLSLLSLSDCGRRGREYLSRQLRGLQRVEGVAFRRKLRSR